MTAIEGTVTAMRAGMEFRLWGLAAVLVVGGVAVAVSVLIERYRAGSGWGGPKDTDSGRF
ncbi:hypothetical protein [Streptomyces sp. NPDC051014]|uniref:hypothetical protein n=1 Tax=Streptomyces sp. NPDC051014 TaxID=3155751 RepID=UPI00340BF33E